MDKSSTKIRSLTVLIALSVCIFLPGCGLNTMISGNVSRNLRHSEILEHHYVGLAVYSLADHKMVFAQNADKYFTPASNTKLFTFYGGLKMIKDRLPALRYIERGDSLIFWGTGDPSFLQTKLKGNDAYQFLKQSNKQLFLANGRYLEGVYGKGWAWDDYNDYYLAEINELPVMDNLVSITVPQACAVIRPKLFRDSFVLDSSVKDAPYKVTRDFNGNRFRYPPTVPPAGFEQQVPYKVDLRITAALLADTLKRPVGLIGMEMPAEAKTVYGLHKDSVLKEMMLPSDNFIAEQLLLVYSDQLGKELSTEKAIDHIQRTYLSGLSAKPVWVDGSGLSRYNLVTPADLVSLLEMIYTEVGDRKRLFALLPAGGKTGTLKNAYPKTDQPYVFGKTGSLSNVYNQSGYLVTKKGRIYIFSFMNNNFVDPTSEVRKAMAGLMTELYNKF